MISFHGSFSLRYKFVLIARFNISVAARSNLYELKSEKLSLETAKKVGEIMGDKLSKLGISEAVFDRGGYVYHGRVKALADGIREKGIKF